MIAEGDSGGHPARSEALAPGRPRLVFLDTLRFAAAWAVVMQHSLEDRCEPCRTVTSALSPGVFGVVLFFLISGFVIPMTASRSFSLAQFTTKRVFRIYPLVLFSFLVVGVVGAAFDIPAFQEVRTAGLRAWIANLLLVENYVGIPSINNVTWTLSLEFAWYAIFAACLLLLGRRFDRWLAVLAPIGILVLTAGSLLMGHRLPLGRIGMMYIAVLGCRASRYHAGELSLPALWLDLGIYLAVTALSNGVAFGYFQHPTITLMEAVAPWTLASILFVSICSSPAALSSRVLNSPILAWLGVISLSTYLLHPVAIHVTDAFTPPATSFFVGIAVTLVLSVAGYHLIELPGQRLGHRLAARLARASGPEAPWHPTPKADGPN